MIKAENTIINKSIKSWLEKNDIETYSTYNEQKSIVVERVIGTLKNRIDKYLTSLPKNVYINKLDNIVNKCNNTYHSTIKKKPVDVKSRTNIDSTKEINNKDPKFKIGGIVKYQNTKTL